MKYTKYMLATIFMVVTCAAQTKNVASGPHSLSVLVDQLKVPSTSPPSSVRTSDRFNPADMSNDREILNLVGKSIFDMGLTINRILLSQRPNNKYEVISPVSIAAALNMIMLGSKGSTFDELMRVLKYRHQAPLFQEPIKIHEKFSELLNTLIDGYNSNDQYVRNYSWKREFYEASDHEDFDFIKKVEDNYQIIVANAIFIQNNFNIRPDFKRIAENLYKCELRNLDFEKEPINSANYINNWVSQQTKGLIANIVGESIDPETRAVITNSIYFKAEWDQAFYESATGPRPFYPNGYDSDSVNVEMMGNGGYFPYYESKELDCRIIGFPYKQNHTAMYIIMPTNSTKHRLTDLQNRLTSDSLEDMIQKMKVKSSIVLFPKLTLTTNVHLRDTLMQLGLQSLFSPKQSDLSLISSNENIVMGAVNSPITDRNTSFTSISRGSEQPIANRGSSPYQSSSLHDQLIFSRLSDDVDTTTKDHRKHKREVKYKVENVQSSDQLNFKNFLLKKRITKPNLDKKKHKRRYSRSVVDLNAVLQQFDQLRHTNLRNPGLYADDVIHKVKLVVDEKGTEAAAATAATINRSGPSVTFKADAPFIVIVRNDDVKLPLFYSTVFEPTM